ncbi:MAG: hypothetical protein HOM14_10610 [Gammaproteobacteria bacterium]|jgi:hypothetical protein|nr:hypothetical protein [Gammaproteobacteria bacterium]MBT4078326.1 hypothetical protein [Gammaproteobacteria bacterium]MBT4194239.1 hypothetical protein [Gammaproteobacteria bacterium]MBT4451609.1 hypothetical protein [Gammaproteobacteria bacterium]MBT4861921.1 hypothetical protein [Gammaproteobacteria bacterium]
MEVIIGDEYNFAIQAMLEPELEPPFYIWGRMCLWVSGIQFGDYNDKHCGLAQCTTHLNQVIEVVDQLSIRVFGDKDDQEIYSFLENAWLNPGHDDFGLESELLEFHKLRFDYGFAEVFDREPMSFLLKLPNDKLKLLFKTQNIEQLNSHIFDVKLFKNLVEKFDDWFNEQSILMDSKNA